MLRIITILAKSNKIRSFHPLEKLALTMLPIVILSYSKNPAIIIFNIIVFIVLHLLNKNAINIVIKFIAGAAFFALLSSVTFVFDYGVSYTVILILKTISGGICLCFLAMTTPMDDLLYTISRAGFLKDACDIAKNMERFLILIEDEYAILHKAIECRGGFDGFALRVKNTGRSLGLLFINTLRRWKEIRDGINSRGYTGCSVYLTEEFSFSKARFFIIAVYNILLVILILKI